MTLLIVAALATWQIVEIWHHSSIFASLRARTELREDLIGEGLMCPFCLSTWVSLLCLTLLHLPWWAGGYISAGVVYAFACARVANLGNDLTHSFCRTPRQTLNPADSSQWGDEDSTS